MKKILIIDDDAQIRSMLRRTLERNGYEVREADNGRVGREILESYAAELIVCDIVMPEEEGIGTIRTVARTHPHLKIIAVSGGSLTTEQYLSHATKFGAHRAFKKPFSLKELAAAVQELLSGG